MVTAVVKRPNRILANTVNLTKTQSNPAVELKNNVSSVSQNYLHNLLDVVEGPEPQTGYTLVYNASTDKYEVKNLITDLNLDGGTF